MGPAPPILPTVGTLFGGLVGDISVDQVAELERRGDGIACELGGMYGDLRRTQ